MTKFKVGDQVIFNNENAVVAKECGYKINKAYEVQEVSKNHNTLGITNEDGVTHFFNEERFEIAETKPTKNQRITALEREVAELKLIVHELRDDRKPMRDVMNEVLSEPSTPTVEDIIEFEGQQYKKVDRLAMEGDVVIIRKPADNNRFPRLNTPYKVVVDEHHKLCINNPDDALVYNSILGRTSKTVEVYELIKSKPLTPNQQRAAIIEKAKEFIDKHDKDIYINVHDNAIIAYKLDTGDFGISKCNTNDVFNEHIGKAIALGRALGLDVSEFEQAVQPNKVVSGMKIKSTIDWPEAHYGKIYKGDIFDVVSGEVRQHRKQCRVNSAISLNSEIIDDTNAIY